MQEDPPSTLTAYNFWDYTITTRRDRIDAASTLQTYYNVWTLVRQQKTGLNIPNSFKGAMSDVRIRRLHLTRPGTPSNQKIDSKEFGSEAWPQNKTDAETSTPR
jgi:hypothetical protein